jgi:LuxR family transcriptional regulator, maltose regulon positive regulatory protein
MMANLLATKFHLPTPPAAPPWRTARRVLRPRLVQRLNEGLQAGRRLTLISAPAGFGKSMCASEWAASLGGQPVAWLSLDASDNDPGRFFTYFIAALQKLDPAARLPGVGVEMAGVLQAGQLPPAEVISTSLINDLLALTGSASRSLLFLDDFHVIQNSFILAVLEKLISNLPSTLHLVLLTREDPALPLARLRANNLLTEVRAADLRFTAAETQRFLNDLMGLSLSQTDLAALEERTEGWIVGLQLAGLSMRDRADPSAFIANLSGSHRFILSYLTEEVLARQPEELQHFLLQTSLLERLNSEVCCAITGLTGSRTLLEKSFAANLFLIPLDDEGQWYRYHHLFADLLQARLRQTFPPGEIAALHQFAAGWFEQNGYPAEAFHHARAAGDMEGLARLIEQNGDAMMTRGELATLIRWMSMLPEAVIRHHPLIVIAKAWMLTLAGEVQQVEPLLHQVELQLSANPETPEARELYGNIAAIRSFFAMLAGEYTAALDLGQRAGELLSERSVQARSLLPYTIGSAYRGQGEYEKAAEAFALVTQIGEKNHNLMVWGTGVTELVNMHRLQGHLHQAEETGRQALQKMVDQGVYPFGSLAKIEVALSEVLREQNQLDEARQRVTGVIARMQDWNMPTDRIFASLALIHILEAQGEIDAAFEELRIAKNLKAANPVLLALAKGIDFSEIRLYLAAGNLSAAARLVDELRPGANRVVSLRQQELALMARLRLAQGRPDEAVNLLEPFVQEGLGSGAPGHLSIFLEIMALHVRALDKQGNHEAALKILLKALSLAEPEGFVRVFVDEGPQMGLMMADCRLRIEDRRTSMDEGLRIRLLSYTTHLLAAFPAPSSQPTSRQSPPTLLTERELEVLRLIAEGLKYEEIAGRLFISLNTVRTYVKGIYGKLDVNNRTRAITLAREMKLI